MTHHASDDWDPRDPTIRAGDRVSLMWIAANRDPEAIGHPDAIDLEREPSANLLFGTGIHRCLGEPLARMELRIAVAELLRRTGRFEVVGPAQPARHVYPSNGLWALPLRLRAAQGSE